MKLWSGRFTKETASAAWDLNASIAFDQRLALQDVRGSIAWAKSLKQAGILTSEEYQVIKNGLQEVKEEFKLRKFSFKKSDEDIHTAVERRLGELIGPLGGKLHTGRSRNDQVATDFRLWLLDHIPELAEGITILQTAIINRAEADLEVIFPGYTHLQRAQPILLSHWWLSHFWAFQRDLERLSQLQKRTAVMPLGSGALAGTAYGINREALSEDLGFLSPSPNSLDAVSDRDFAAEFLFFAALTGVHMSRLAEGIILFTSAEFGFIELSDAYATGSSLLPQKKNPDVFEIARGKTGTLLGYLTGLLATLKGLPSAYDKDLQEDKVPVFNAFDTLMALSPVLAGALDTLTIKLDKIRSALDANMMAVDLADHLVEQGIPFREAHKLVGQAVQKADENNRTLDSFSAEEFLQISPSFGPEVPTVFDFQRSVARHQAIGGTAPEAVRAQLERAKKEQQENQSLSEEDKS